LAGPDRATETHAELEQWLTQRSESV
jgi:hypothetical protein